MKQIVKREAVMEQKFEIDQRIVSYSGAAAAKMTLAIADNITRVVIG